MGAREKCLGYCRFLGPYLLLLGHAVPSRNHKGGVAIEEVRGSPLDAREATKPK